MNGSFLVWEGAWPLVLMTLAIATAAWMPLLSLGFTVVLLAGQLTHVVPAMEPNHWAIYLGSFFALAFILWSGSRRVRWISAGINVVAAAVMAFMMLSWRYGDGVGWYQSMYYGDMPMLGAYGWQLFALLLVIAAGCAAVGLLLSQYEERGRLFRAKELAQRSLMEAEVGLVVEQERTRISRDLHDVLAHSLAVIAAQADGTRYLSKDQPKSVVNALETIAKAARHALVDAQRVIEGVGDDGMASPQPQLSDLPALIEGMQRGSLAINSGESGTAVKLSSGQEVAVFRIVQECLTNALKHGGRGTGVRLHFDWSGPGLTLHVASAMVSGEPDVHGASAPTRVGRGLPGMRERAHMAGGWLTAGPDGEHFRVTVFVPYGVQDSGPDDEDALVAAWAPVTALAEIDETPVMAGVGLGQSTATEGTTVHRG